MPSRLVAGIDLGGAQVRIAVAPTGGGEIFASTNISTSALKGPRGFVDRASRSIEQISSGASSQFGRTDQRQCWRLVELGLFLGLASAGEARVRVIGPLPGLDITNQRRWPNATN